MLKWVDRSATRALAVWGIVIGCLAPVTAGQEATVSSQVHRAATHGTVEQFASALAKSKTPVGVLLLQNDVRAAKKPIADASPDERVPLADALRDFEQHQPAYYAERGAADAMVVIKPRAGGRCRGILDSHVDSVSASGEAFDVLYRLYLTWAGRRGAYTPPSVVGRPREEVGTYRTHVSIHMLRPSLEGALSAVVQQAPGLGWAMREITVTPRTSNGPSSLGMPACNLTLFDDRSWVSTSWTFDIMPGGH